MGYYTDYLIKAKGDFAMITELYNFLANQRIDPDYLTQEEKEMWDKRDKAFPFPCTFPYGQLKDEKIYADTSTNKTPCIYNLSMVLSFKYIWNFGIVLYIQDYLKRMNNHAKVLIYSLSEGSEKPSLHFVDKDYTYTLLTADMYNDYLADVKEGLAVEVGIELEGSMHLFNYFVDINNKEAVKKQVDSYPNILKYPSPIDLDNSDELIIRAYFTPHPDWFYLAFVRSKLNAAHLVDDYGVDLFLSSQYTTPWMRSFF